MNTILRDVIIKSVMTHKMTLCAAMLKDNFVLFFLFSFNVSAAVWPGWLS